MAARAGRPARAGRAALAAAAGQWLGRVADDAAPARRAGRLLGRAPGTAAAGQDPRTRPSGADRDLLDRRGPGAGAARWRGAAHHRGHLHGGAAAYAARLHQRWRRAVPDAVDAGPGGARGFLRRHRQAEGCRARRTRRPIRARPIPGPSNCPPCSRRWTRRPRRPGTPRRSPTRPCWTRCAARRSDDAAVLRRPRFGTNIRAGTKGRRRIAANIGGNIMTRGITRRTALAAGAGLLAAPPIVRRGQRAIRLRLEALRRRSGSRSA